jgi:sulfatase maturation enzyme AslB (radical SAM superfamily)
MAQITDISSPTTKTPPSHLELLDNPQPAKPQASPMQECEDMEACLQDLDMSCLTTVANRGVCNLGCSYCAIRWHHRRLRDLQES